MSTTTTKDQTRSDKARTAVGSVRANGNVAWYADRNGEFYPPEDTPVYGGEVYELVAEILKYAPFRSLSHVPTELIIEVTNHRAWPGFAMLVLAIFEDAHLHDEARRV